MAVVASAVYLPTGRPVHDAAAAFLSAVVDRGLSGASLVRRVATGAGMKGREEVTAGGGVKAKKGGVDEGEEGRDEGA